MENLKRFRDLVSDTDTEIFVEAKFRVENHYWLKESKRISFKVLSKLKERGMTQKQLAEMMQVSPQQINKWVKGNEKFSLDTLLKLQEVLDVPIMASYYEKNNKKAEELISTFEDSENISYPNITEPSYNYSSNFSINEKFKIAN
jgi:transcriptional regulator with XRE-family HTH domain